MGGCPAVSIESEFGESGFAVLHQARVRGFITAGGDDSDAGRLETLELLAAQELGGRQGWVLTGPGFQLHERELVSRRDEQLSRAVGEAHREFLTVNQDFKDLCAEWQSLPAIDPAQRQVFVAELADVCQAAGAALGGAAAEAPWLAEGATRLATALEAFRAGDDRYLTSALVESVHTVWGQVHEDLLVTLGVERSEADEA